MAKTPLQICYLIAGWICLILGLIGAVIPLLPTTPFVLLAAFCFSKGSERLYHWLRNNPYVGKNIQDWEDHKVIRPRAKALATLMIVLLFGYTIFYVHVNTLIKTIVALIGISVLSFILTRPSQEQPRLKGDGGS